MHKTVLILLFCIILLTGAASAAHNNTMLIDSLSQEITISATGTYEVAVKTNAPGNHTISFDTQSPDILARMTRQGIDTGSPNVTGSVVYTPPYRNDWYSFTLHVTPSPGATADTRYCVIVKDTVTDETFVRASVTASVIPVLEAGGSDNRISGSGSGKGTYPPGWQDTPVPAAAATPVQPAVTPETISHAEAEEAATETVAEESPTEEIATTELKTGGALNTGNTPKIRTSLVMLVIVGVLAIAYIIVLRLRQ